MRAPKHPIPVQTIFRRCLLANFAVDPDVMRLALPTHIEPDLHDGAAYLSVVVGQMEKMRPAAVPKALGITYNQIVYRAVVRYRDERGVHFLRSDADSRVMCTLGNLMSFFRFNRSAISFREHDGILDLDVAPRDDPAGIVHASYTIGRPSRTMPPHSGFSDLSTATSWLVELFTAFDHTPGRDSIDVVRIRRGQWDVSVVDDLRGEYELMKRTPFSESTAKLDSVFLVGDVPYHWHRLEHLPLTPTHS